MMKRTTSSCWCATGSLFSAGAAVCVPSLLTLHKFPSLNFCHDNKAKWPLIRKHINWVDNLKLIINAKYDLHHFTCYGENAIFNHFPIISLWYISVVIPTKQKGRSA